MKHCNVLREAINTPGFAVNIAQSFNSVMQQTIELQTQDAIDQAEKCVNERLAKREEKIRKSNKFDKILWKNKVEKYINICLEIFNKTLLPGVLMKPETNARREVFKVRISSLLQTREYEMFSECHQLSCKRQTKK